MDFHLKIDSAVEMSIAAFRTGEKSRISVFLLQRKHLHHLDLGVTLRDENPTGGRPQGQAVSAAHTTRNRPLGVSSYFLGYGTNRCCCHSPTLHKS